jgi:fructose-bisphosphate aldolase class 1
VRQDGRRLHSVIDVRKRRDYRASGASRPGCAHGARERAAPLRYAALCQAAGIVAIVEPEVLMDGDHPIETCETVTTDTLRAVFDEPGGDGRRSC